MNPGSRYAPDTGSKARGERLTKREADYRQARCMTSDRPLVSVVTVVKDDIKGLEQTIRSLRSQDYTNIEHVVIDGNSENSDGILELCESYGTALALSEGDHGIYDAMNKGISFAQGEYICVLNAGDTYRSDFVRRGQVLLRQSTDPLSLVYGGIAGEPTADEWSDGILVHHLHINHQAFMVPAATYRAVGGYSTLYKVVSDIAWARAALLLGVRALHVGSDMLAFAPGGLSSSAKFRELIKRENAELTKAVFGCLSLGQAQEIYEFRFRPALADAIHLIAETADEPLRASIASALRYLLNAKRLVIKDAAINESFVGLFRLCSLLGVEHSKIWFENSPNTFNTSCITIERFTRLSEEQPDKPCLLHYLEVFNRASETFVYDLIRRNEDHDYAENLILCDKRELGDVRPHPNVVCVPWSAMHPLIREGVYNLIFVIRWKCIISHFALNSEKLLLRLHRYQWGKYRFLHMLHGIDVFLLRDRAKKAYTSLIVDHISQLSNHSFTTPSKFLKARAGLEGIPLSKISVVHNCANKIFYAHRKASDFYQPGKSQRELRILAVGRLIGWKNHARLLEAFAQAKVTLGIAMSLTIVYGNDDTELGPLTKLISALGIEKQVVLTKFVNFQEDPGYFRRYDLFVMGSTYSEDGARRTETFGVATLEAIAAGLPVLISNAGASPEIVEGMPGPHTQVFKHNSVEDFSQKLMAMAVDSLVFSNNQELADRVLDKYSEIRQLELLWRAITKHPSSTVNVLQISSDASGGAGGAAWRCHRGLRKAGLNSVFLCRKFSELPNDYLQTELITWNDTPTSRYNHKQPPGPFQIKPGNSILSIDEEHFSNSQLLELVAGFDIVHLSWVARFLTTANIAFITQHKPTVFTVRDMHPITGGCHYLHGCTKFEGDCASPCPQMDHDHRHVPNQVMQAKLSNWNFTNLSFIGISEITAGVIRRSKLGSMAQRVEVIQNGFAEDYMHYHTQASAKQELGLEADEKYILFMPSYSSTVKGADLASRALQSLYQNGKLQGCIVLIAGETDRQAINLGRIPTESLGFIKEKKKLNLLYSASDITLVPSQEETFSNTCAEAMLSGCPVVGYAAGAIPEMIVDQHTGILAKDFEFGTLASAIELALGKIWEREGIRKSLLDRFSLQRNSEAHQNLYERVLTDAGDRSEQEVHCTLRSIQRLGELTHQRESVKALTCSTQLNDKNMLLSSCKSAVIWVSGNGHLCMSLSTYTLRHYIWLGSKINGIAGSKPVKSRERDACCSRGDPGCT